MRTVTPEIVASQTSYDVKSVQHGLAVVIQNDVGNRFSDLTIVAPITSKFDAELYPTEVLVKAPEGGLKTDSVALLNQIRAVDKRRLGRRLGTLHPSTIALVNEALAISIGLAEL